MYLKSNIPEVSYFKAMTACAICGYIKTALKVCEDKVNKDNVDTAIIEDVGQMDMYVRMYDELKKAPDDNPTIGIVLCSETDEDYSTILCFKRK